ncbi:MAG: NnrS family protein [Burkholderiales bacterium]|nr:NnrS family protein [Burkholderiales bacterium]
MKAIWQLGFRPFYLAAGTYAALSIALWGLQFTGRLPMPYLPSPLWHAHEMLFGFALPVIVGFLFTAGRNWSGLPTPTGGKLAAMLALWLAGRVLVLTPWVMVSAVVNAAFPIAAAIALAFPFIRSGNRRNYFFIALLGLMGAATVAVHFGRVEGVQVGLDVVLFIMAVMGGRVIPMFTNSGVPAAGAERRPWVEKAALGSVLALLAADVLQLQAPWLVVIAAAAAIAHFARFVLWKPWRTGSNALVWVLHAAYVWIPLHLALRALAAAGWVSGSPAVHALTVGALGALVAGMMTRTSKGHTGRLLKADRWDVACYSLVLLAGVVRVGLPMVAPVMLMQAVLVSAALWAAGFGLFVARYWPVLTKARLDGAAG